MSLEFADRTKKVKLSPIREIFEMASRVPDLVRLEVGQPDLDTPVNIRNAGKSAIDEGHIGYTNSGGLDETRRALLNRLNTDYGITFDPIRESVITTGASAALYLTLRTLVGPGDEVLRPDPGWAQYDGVTTDCDGVPVLYPLLKESGFTRIDFEALNKLVSPKTKVMILCNPNNPAGSVLPKEELLKAYEFAKARNIYLISDEAYGSLIYSGSYVPLMSVVDDKKHIITMGSASKGYAMCGWRMGYVIGNSELCSHVTVFQSLTNLCPPYVSMKAYAAALADSQEPVRAMREEYAARREYFIRALNEIKGFKCCPPEGAFYAFVDVSELTDDDMAFCKHMIQNVKVTCIPGSSFGSMGKGYIRFSYAAGMDTLKEGIRRMKAAFGEK